MIIFIILVALLCMVLLMVYTVNIREDYRVENSKILTIWWGFIFAMSFTISSLLIAKLYLLLFPI